MNSIFRRLVLSNINISNVKTQFNFSRWTARKPLRVLTVEEYERESKNRQRDSTLKPFKNSSITHSDQSDDINASANSEEDDIKLNTKSKRTGKKKIQPSKSKHLSEIETVTIRDDGKLVYAKMADRDPRVGSILTTVKSHKEKTCEDHVLLEGKRLILDALDANCDLEYVLFSRLSDLEFIKNKLPTTGVRLYKMPYREMQMWSTVTTTPGIMGIIRCPDTEKYVSYDANTQPPLPITFVLDNIREPGNLGAMLRVCAGISCRNVLLTKGCTSLWDSKVVRSASGAHFRLQIHRKVEFRDAVNMVTTAPNVSKDQLKVVIGDLKGGLNLPLVPYYSMKYSPNEHVVVIIGGETEGISEECYDFAVQHSGVCVNIPLHNGVESLNAGAALAVIGFNIKEQLLNK